MTTVVPAVGYLLMLIPMHFYNITGESHRKMMAEIKERRAQLAEETKKKEAEKAEAVDEK